MRSQLPSHKRPLLAEKRPPLIAPGDLQFILAVGFIYGLRLLPPSARPRFLMQFSKTLGTLWHKSNMQDVRRVRAHLQKLFPDRWTAEEIETIVRRQLSLTAWNFMTLNLIPTLTSEQSANLLPVDGMAHLDEVMAKGKPALLLGAHVGPYAYPIASVLLANQFPVHEIGHVQPRKGSSWLYRKLYWPRVAATVKHLDVVNTLEGPQVALLNILQNNEILYLLPDQFYIVTEEENTSRHLLPIQFLNHSVNLETGGLRLAKMMNAEIFTVLPVSSTDSYRVAIEPLTLPTTGGRPADLAQDLQVFMHRVERCIVEQPYLWRDLRRNDLLLRLGLQGAT